MWMCQQICKISPKKLNRSENIPKSFRSTYFETPCTLWLKKACRSSFRHNFGQMLTDFQNSFTAGLSNKSAARPLLYFPLHLKCVATLPCKTQMFKFYRAKELSAASRNARLAHSKNAEKILGKSHVDFVFHWRKFTVHVVNSYAANFQNDRVYALAASNKQHVAPACLLRTRLTFSKSLKSLMVSVRKRVHS